MTTNTFNLLRGIIADHPECISFYFDLSGRVHIEVDCDSSSISCTTTAKRLALLLSYSTLVLK